MTTVAVIKEQLLALINNKQVSENDFQIQLTAIREQVRNIHPLERRKHFFDSTVFKEFEKNIIIAKEFIRVTTRKELDHCNAILKSEQKAHLFFTDEYEEWESFDDFRSEMIEQPECFVEHVLFNEEILNAIDNLQKEVKNKFEGVATKAADAERKIIVKRMLDALAGLAAYLQNKMTTLNTSTEYSLHVKACEHFIVFLEHVIQRDATNIKACFDSAENIGLLSYSGMLRLSLVTPERVSSFSSEENVQLSKLKEKVKQVEQIKLSKMK